MSTNTIKISARLEIHPTDDYYGTFTIVGRTGDGERVITAPVDETGVDKFADPAQALRARAEMFRKAAVWMDQSAARIEMASAEAAE
jgi:hypothetical protein